MPGPQKLKQVVIRDNIHNFLCIINSLHTRVTSRLHRVEENHQDKPIYVKKKRL